MTLKTVDDTAPVSLGISILVFMVSLLILALLIYGFSFLKPIQPTQGQGPVRSQIYADTLFAVKLSVFIISYNCGVVAPVKFFYIQALNGHALTLALAYGAVGFGSCLSMVFNVWVRRGMSIRRAMSIACVFGIVGMILYSIAVDAKTIIASRIIFGIYFGTLSLW